jgi:Tfp pilus assembly protein PilF
LKLGAFYHQRKNSAKAEQELRQVLAIDPASASAKQILAVLLASRGGEAAWKEVRSLLQSGDGDDIVRNERLCAVLVSGRGRPQDLDEARRLLEGIVREPFQVTPGDRMLLAWIYARLARLILEDDADRAAERSGLLAAARAQYEHLVYQDKPDGTHVAAAVEFSLSLDEHDDAQRHIDILRRIEPTSDRPTMLQARLLHARGQAAEMSEFVQAWVDEKSAGAEQKQAQLLAGRTLRSLGMYENAAVWFRRAYEQDAALYPSLAVALALQDDVQRRLEAVELCLAAADGDLKKQVSALASVFVAARSSPKNAAACEPLFERALELYADDPQVLMAVANVRLVQGDSARAEQLYRRVLAIHPADAVVLNNLAAILAEQHSQVAEAERLIDRAIEKSGELPYLLDTKGIVLLSRGRVDESVDLLERAAALDSDPRHLFHYITALWKAQDMARARKMWERLDQTALRRTLLTSMDQRLLRELSRVLDG